MHYPSNGNMTCIISNCPWNEYIALGLMSLQWGLFLAGFIVLSKTILKEAHFLSGPYLHRNWFIKVIGVCFTKNCSNAIFLGISGSHAILKVFQAWRIGSHIMHILAWRMCEILELLAHPASESVRWMLSIFLHRDIFQKTLT